MRVSSDLVLRKVMTRCCAGGGLAPCARLVRGDGARLSGTGRASKDPSSGGRDLRTRVDALVVAPSYVRTMTLASLSRAATGALLGTALGFVAGILSSNAFVGLMSGAVLAIVLAWLAARAMDRGTPD